MTQKHKVFILLLTVIVSVALCYDGDERDHTGCPVLFQGKCTCGKFKYPEFYGSGTHFMTNCTNTGFRNTTMLEYMPEETEVLIFTGNHLETLPWNIFGIFDPRSNLRVVDLTNNGIKEIQGKTFHKVTTVKRLILNHNDLYIVSAMHHTRTFSNFENLEELHLTNAFTEQIDSKWYLNDLKDIFQGSQLSKLKKLHLEQNEIWEIQDDDIDLFCDLPALMDLHLGDNQLTDINFSLACMKNLRYLDLEFNKITNLRKVTLDKIETAFTSKTSNRQINLQGNPFKCDCYMRPFFDWLKITKVNLRSKEDYRCWTGEPEANAGKRITNVQSLPCPVTEVSEDHNTSRHATTNSLLTVLIVLTLVLLAVVLWVNRAAVKQKMKPVVENINRHVTRQYSAIEKNEEEPSEVNVWANPFSGVSDCDLLEWENLKLPHKNNRNKSKKSTDSGVDCGQTLQLPLYRELDVSDLSETSETKKPSNQIHSSPSNQIRVSPSNQIQSSLCRALVADCYCEHCEDASGFYWG
jgi:hypothetical protein